MKTNIYIIISLFILIVLGINLSNKSEETSYKSGFKLELQSPADTTILIGAYDMGNLKESYKIKDSLGFNLWHKYLTGIRDISGRALPHGWIQSEDSLYKMDYSEGFDSVKSIFSGNSTYDIKMLMMRPKTEWICYGQRSDYQCEEAVENPEYNWFYTYREHECGIDYTDTSRFGNGVKVRYCSQNSQDSGYVVKGLKANREQINMKYYPGMGDNEAKWYLKPRIRIDSAFAYNNQFTKICRIEIYDFDSNLVRYADLIGRNFWDDGNPYSGQYIENYFRNISDSLTIISSFILNPDTLAWTNTTCKVDYRVFWYGNCDMWIDYFRVDDERANILFGDTTSSSTIMFYNMLQLEVDLASQYSSSLDFYIDEFEFNHLPCIKKVSEIIRNKSNNRFSINFVAGYDWWYWAHLPEDSIPPFTVQKNHYIKYCIDSVKPKYVIGGDYPFDTNRLYPSSLTPPDPNSQYLFGSPATAGVYDNWLQGYLDDTTRKYCGFIKKIKDVSGIAEETGLEVISPMQSHLWVTAGTAYLSEPTNEEMELMANLYLSYGSKGIFYFYYGGYNCPEEGEYKLGLAEQINTNCWNENKNLRPRYINIYGQEKLKKVKQISETIHSWTKALKTFSINGISSYRYYNQEERTQLLNSSYINEITTYAPLPADLNSPSPLPEEQQYRYIQASVMENTEPNTTYLMLINRRCSPYLPAQSENGGRRLIKLSIDTNSNEFSNFRNWKVIDIQNDSTIAVFDKTNPEIINLGWFLPAEGRIYKIAPIMQEGGTLETDENIGNINPFDCKDMVFGNGHNITIGQGTTIYFADSAGIEMQSGNFLCGNDITFGTIQVNLKPKVADNGWNGISVFDGGQVYIYNTLFENPKNGSYSLSLSNTYGTKIKYSTFNCLTEGNKGGIMTSYVSNSEYPPSYISYNTFSIKESELPALCIISSSGGTTNPVIIEWNNFTTSGSPLEAINFTNVQGGEIKNNTITNYVTGIKLLMSSTGIFNNQIGSNLEESCGIDASNSQVIGGTSGSYFTGGLNSIVLSGSGSNCIKVTDSYFNVDCGYNLFDVDVSNSPYHWSGYVPEDIQDIRDARKNCFKSNTVIDTARSSITYGEEGDLVDFNFEDYDCSNYFPENYEVLAQNDGYKDTLYIYSGGEGGAEKDGENKDTETISYKTLKDSINILIRKRDFTSAGTKLKEIISLYSDSSFCFPAIGMLFHCTRQTDSTGIKIQEIKTFYELAMQNNSGKPELLKRLYYYTQKCKVVLGQYNSALEGFLYIMQNNQYNLLGLLANWDYAATQLLMGSGGSRIYSAFENTNNFEPDDSVRFSKPVELNKVRDNYDAAIFTKEDRKKLIKNVETAMEYEKKSDERRYDNLKEKMKNPGSRESRKIQKEITKIEKIKEVVKIKKPKTHNEFTEIVRKDMLTVFGRRIDKEINGKENIIPAEYELKQNYPNPFNPVTKISFALPKESKVKLIIYDMLGREVARLINNENLSAGTYIREFNGSNLSSGIYFLRILANDGKDFSDVKKIVLIK